MVTDQLLAPALFPERHWVDDRARAAAEATQLGGTAGTYALRRGTIFALEQWVSGGTFHPYGVSALDALEADLGVEEAVRELGKNRGDLKIEGELVGYRSGMTWHVWYRRSGGIDGEFGGCAGYSTPEDAAYACLTHIEEHEREAYLEQLVVGIA